MLQRLLPYNVILFNIVFALHGHIVIHYLNSKPDTTNPSSQIEACMDILNIMTWTNNLLPYVIILLRH